MLNNKTNSAISHSKTKAATYPDLRGKFETLAIEPLTPCNTPTSSNNRATNLDSRGFCNFVRT